MILSAPDDLPGWRVGEALAEVYLIEHRQCEFPWPGGRDLKNPSASPAGTDLVGFYRYNDEVRFAFGEVKTSNHSDSPPSVVTGRHGLSEQLSDLRDSTDIKGNLVRYLGHHATRASWRPTFEAAVSRFLGSRPVILGIHKKGRSVESVWLRCLDTNPYSLRPTCAAPFVELPRIICFTIALITRATALAPFLNVSSVANASPNVAVPLSST